MDADHRYLFGPVPSWRLGRSLGIDLLSREQKICTFDCVYCQLGRTAEKTGERGLFVSTEDVLAELARMPDVPVDYLTFSGRGEPTLALNLGEVIRAVSKERPRGRIAVLTNASLLWRPDVREDLIPADLVVAKLDAPDAATFAAVDRPAAGIAFDRVIQGLREFRIACRGRFALQIMILPGTLPLAGKIRKLAESFSPDEVQLNTPLRPCSAEPAGRPEMEEVKRTFAGMPVLSVYDASRPRVQSLSSDDTLWRRGKIEKPPTRSTPCPSTNTNAGTVEN